MCRCLNSVNLRILYLLASLFSVSAAEFGGGRPEHDCGGARGRRHQVSSGEQRRGHADRLEQGTLLRRD